LFAINSGPVAAAFVRTIIGTTVLGGQASGSVTAAITP